MLSTSADWLAPALVGILTILLLVAALRAQRRRRSGAGDPGVPIGGDGQGEASDVAARGPRVARFVYGLAVVAAIVSSLGTVVATIVAAVSDTVALSVPVQSFMPSVSPGVFDVQGRSAEIVAGPGFSTGDFTIQGLDAAARAWLVGGILSSGIVAVFLMVLVATLAGRAVEAEPFARPLSGLIARAGLVLGIGGVVWQICFAIAGNLAAAQVFGVAGFASNADLNDRNTGLGLGASGLPAPGFGFTLDFWPIGVGLALVTAAILFRTGERLQSETRGLV